MKNKQCNNARASEQLELVARKCRAVRYDCIYMHLRIDIRAPASGRVCVSIIPSPLPYPSPGNLRPAAAACRCARPRHTPTAARGTTRPATATEGCVWAPDLSWGWVWLWPGLCLWLWVRFTPSVFGNSQLATGSRHTIWPAAKFIWNQCFLLHSSAQSVPLPAPLWQLQFFVDCAPAAAAAQNSGNYSVRYKWICGAYWCA